VVLFAGTSAPNIIYHSGNSSDVVGKANVSLECAADGYPRPFVKWYRDNKEITVPNCTPAIDLPSCDGQYSLKSWSVTSTVVRSQLVINKFEESKATKFSCYALNKFGHTTADIYVVPGNFFSFLFLIIVNHNFFNSI